MNAFFENNNNNFFNASNLTQCYASCGTFTPTPSHA